MAVKITILGKVHDVGYRLFLLEEADRLFIPCFDARNVKINGKEALIVLVDGEKEKIEEFIEFIRSEKPEKAVVEEIKVEEYVGSVREIDRFRNSFNTAQLSKIVQVGLKMLEKQDETIKVIKEESEKTRLTVREESEKTRQTVREESEKTRGEIGAKIDSAKEEIGGKLDLLRSDLREYMELNFKRISDEMNEIKKEFERLKEALRRAGISV